MATSQVQLIYGKPYIQISKAFSYKPDRPFLDRAKIFAFKLSSEFEGGRPNSLQLKDSGVISYGKHQANLKSGALFRLLDYYTGISNSLASEKLSSYLERVRSADVSLRNDVNFIDLLMQAADDPLMNAAQDKIFSENYWMPAVKLAEEVGLRSELGYAIFYDTNVQGGLKSVIERVNKKVLGYMDEKEYLETFLQCRREYLLAIAANKKNQGDTVSAKYLENSARNRIGRLEQMLKVN